MRRAHLAADGPRRRDATARHLALAEATFGQLAPGAVISHVSAAIRNRLPV